MEGGRTGGWQSAGKAALSHRRRQGEVLHSLQDLRHHERLRRRRRISDGKYNLTNEFGGTLYEYIGKQKAMELMHYVDDINVACGGAGTKLYSTADSGFKRLCLQTICTCWTPPCGTWARTSTIRSLRTCTPS